MKTISQIKQEQQDKVSAIFAELGVFFAFSDEQFNRSRKEGVTYVHMGQGMIAPKESARRVHDEFDRIHNEIAALFQQHIPMADYILAELRDHECFYTGNYSEILENVQQYYPECTLEALRKVFRANNK